MEVVKREFEIENSKLTNINFNVQKEVLLF